MSPEQHRQYHRDYMRRYRAKGRKVSVASETSATGETCAECGLSLGSTVYVSPGAPRCVSTRSATPAI